MDSWTNIAVRFTLYLDLMLLFGLPLFGLYAFRHHERDASHIVRPFAAVLAISAVIGIAMSVFSLVVMAKAMTGASDYFSVGEHAFSMILSGTAFGAAWLIRIVSLIVGLGAAVFLVRKPTFALVTATIAGGIALSTLAWGGHGAMDEGGKGVLHLSSDILHLIAAGGWVGALAAFVLLLRVDHSAPNERIQLLSRTLASFAAVGSMIVLALIATGLINYGMIVGPTLSGLLTTSYGQLLLVKLAVFGLMLALAAANRFHLTPLLEASIRRGDHQGAILALRKSLFVESGAATAILALVAVLGTMSPQ